MYAKWQDCLGKNFVGKCPKAISPTTQRVIWCYGQWQPSHFDIMITMPGIEFNEGIPGDIDEPGYLDVSQRNLIVPAKTNVLLISLREEVITGICRSSTLCKIVFIKARKYEILAQMPTISCCSSHPEINNKFPCSPDN